MGQHLKVVGQVVAGEKVNVVFRVLRHSVTARELISRLVEFSKANSAHSGTDDARTYAAHTAQRAASVARIETCVSRWRR